MKVVTFRDNLEDDLAQLVGKEDVDGGAVPAVVPLRRKEKPSSIIPVEFVSEQLTNETQEEEKVEMESDDGESVDLSE